MRIKKLLLATVLVLATVIALTGCLESVDLNKLGIVAGIAIDKIDDEYIVTAQILNPAAIVGETPNALTVYSLKADGKSIHEAWNRLDNITSSALYLSHLNVIVINEEFAKAGFSPLLNFALRHAQIRPNISIVVAKEEKASDVLSVVTAIDTIPAAQLDVSSMVPSHTPRLTNYNLYSVIDMVNTNSVNVVLNAITIHREEEHTDKKVERKDGTEGATTRDGNTIDNILDITRPVQLRAKHLAIFQGDKLAGYIDDREAQLYNMVMGENKRYTVVTRIEEDYYTSFRVAQVKSKITTDLANNEATIKLNLGATIVENTYPIDLTNSDNLKVMSDYLKAQVEHDMDKFVDKIQNELKSDIFGIGGKAYYKENKIWKEKEGYWAETFPKITINVEIEVEIDSVGEVGNVTL